MLSMGKPIDAIRRTSGLCAALMQLTLVASAAEPGRKLSVFLGGGALKYLSVHSEFEDPWAPTAALGIQLDSGMQPRLSAAVEWTPSRTFMRWPGGGRTRVGTVSGLAALEWSRQGRVGYAAVVGLSRQIA